MWLSTKTEFCYNIIKQGASSVVPILTTGKETCSDSCVLLKDIPPPSQIFFGVEFDKKQKMKEKQKMTRPHH